MLVQLLKGILRASREALPFRAQKTAAERQTASAGDWTSIRSRPVFLLGKLISLVDCVISIAPRKSNISPARAHETRRKPRRSEEHTSELPSLMRISYAVFCLQKKTNNKKNSYSN